MAGFCHSRDGAHAHYGIWHSGTTCLTGADGGSMEDAYIWTVLFLMATPYAVMACVGGWLVYRHRRASAKEKRVEGETPPAQLTLHWKEDKR